MPDRPSKEALVAAAAAELATEIEVAVGKFIVATESAATELRSKALVDSLFGSAVNAMLGCTAVTPKSADKQSPLGIPTALQKELMTLKEACDTLDVSRWVIYRLCKAGQIKRGPDIGKAMTVVRKSLEAYVTRIESQI